MNDTETESGFDARIAELVRQLNVTRRYSRALGIALVFVFAALATFAASRVGSTGFESATFWVAVGSAIAGIATNLLFLYAKSSRQDRNRLEMLQKILLEQTRSRNELVHSHAEQMKAEVELQAVEAEAELKKLQAQRLELIEKMRSLQLDMLETVFDEKDLEGEPSER